MDYTRRRPKLLPQVTNRPIYDDEEMDKTFVTKLPKVIRIFINIQVIEDAPQTLKHFFFLNNFFYQYQIFFSMRLAQKIAKKGNYIYSR